jgi:hypothetical protein
MAFHCTICGEESTRICVWCTKDTCGNHLCERCGRCSDCCECEVRLDELAPAGATILAMPAPPPESEALTESEALPEPEALPDAEAAPPHIEAQPPAETPVDAPPDPAAAESEPA